MNFQKFVTQRLAAITAMINAIATNAKKIDELPIQSVLNPASKIHVSRSGVSESLELQKIIDAANSLSYDRLIAIGTITLVGNVITVPAGAQWKINNIMYGNISGIPRTVPYCATGLIRKDILVANTSNDMILIKGLEMAGIAIRPNIPLNTVLVTEIVVTDTTIGNPSEPIIGDKPVSATESGIVNNTALQELGGVDKLINGIRIGKGSGTSTAFNTVLGALSLPVNTTGTQNTALGYYTLSVNTTGGLNTAVGTGAMGANTTGVNNTAVGASALASNISGQRNVAIGMNALVRAGGNNNTALGSSAGASPSGQVGTGSSNITIGFQSGRDITTGNNNILIENIINASITTGSRNIVLNPINKTGVTTGDNNVIIGGYDGAFAATMSDNVILGTGAGSTRLISDETGLTKLPAQTIALINADTSGKAAVTKEYLGSKELNATATLDFPETFTSQNPRLTISVTGAAPGDFVLVSGPILPNGCFYTAYVSAVNEVSVCLHNMNNGPVNLPPSEFKIKIFK